MERKSHTAPAAPCTLPSFTTQLTFKSLKTDLQAPLSLSTQLLLLVEELSDVLAARRLWPYKGKHSG